MTSMEIRQAAVAGLFYPDDASSLQQAVDGYLYQAELGAVPKALIVPHAGYIYSGQIAASAYKRLHAAREKISRVIVLGPSHRVAFRGVAVSSAGQFSTPLGNVVVDRQAVEEVLVLPQVQLMNEAHQMEHSLEVQLPFLQRVLDDFLLVPLVVGECSAEDLAEVLELLWGGDETLIVVSSDLSHFLNYQAAKEKDELTSAAIVSLSVDDIHDDDACGRVPVKGLLAVAAEKALRVELIDQCNSGDTAGDRDRVVGYGAYAFY